MVDSLDAVVEATGGSEAEILRKGVESYVQQEIREARVRIEELRDTYGVEEPDDLESRIERGDVDMHPAWEELIEWRNLRDRKTRLDRL